MRSRRPVIPACVFAIAAVSVLAAGCGSGSSTTARTTAPGGTLAYTHCMRSHGVPNFPDPSSGEIPKNEVAPLVGGPQFATADTACQHLVPATGLGRSETLQQAHTRFADMLAFVGCLRRHGFSNVPDPSSSGQLTPEMVAQAGINLHQPAVLQAADECVSVTHGLLTEADVARALNDAGA
jgi:hypothetical protein